MPDASLNSLWADPVFRALMGALACVVALVLIQLIDEWDKFRDEARRERHIRKNRWWRD